jgi:alginate O-acetyltransferase complex protein AlgI
MLFHSIEFLLFFSFFYSLYLTLPHIYQNRLLLVASYVFYGSWNWKYLFLLFVSTLCDYFCGLKILSNRDKKIKKRFVVISIAFNLTLLGVFKYFDFFAESFGDLFRFLGFGVQPYFLEIVLPVGISFYTFQTMSYTIDVYRGKIQAERNFFDFAIYVAFFPQLIAGPIERATRLLPQILQPRVIKVEHFFRGALLFYWGLFLKIFIADNLARIVDPIFSQLSFHNGSEVLIAVYAFSFQIFCDFLGYSLMAIGLAKVMGIELMENFRQPYFSRNIAEFWRRWHISLSSWLRDYLYVPLGGNQKGARRTCINILITMLLGGLWHGASWSFGVFGIYHGILIGIHHNISKVWNRVNPIIQIFLTYQLVCLGWLIFRASSAKQAYEMLISIFNNFQILPRFFENLIEIVLIISILLMVELFQEMKNDSLIILKMHKGLRYFFIILLTILMYFGGDFSDQPFIYFQF